MEHDVTEVTLKNKSKGLLVHVPGGNVVNFSIEFRAGFNVGDWKKFELPHVMEHVMFTNKTYPKPRQFSKVVEKNGAYHNATTTDISLRYEYECAEFEAERIAELINVQISEPIFPAAELKSEISNVREELSNYFSNNYQLCAENLYAHSRKTPDLQARIDQLKGISVEDLHRFYEKTHKGGNMRFVIAGDTDFRSLTKHLEEVLPASTRMNVPIIRTKPLPEPIFTTRSINQIYYTFYSVSREHLKYRDLIAARIVTSILSNGFSSTLLGLARERGLIYTMAMDVDDDIYETMLRWGGYVTTENSQKFFNLAKGEISKARQGKFSEKQFKATKELLLGQRALQYQQLSNLTSYYRQYFEDDKYENFENFSKHIKEISKHEAVDAFNRLFKDKNWGMSFVGDVKREKVDQLHGIVAEIWK